MDARLPGEIEDQAPQTEQCRDQRQPVHAPLGADGRKSGRSRQDHQKGADPLQSIQEIPSYGVIDRKPLAIEDKLVYFFGGGGGGGAGRAG
uniref:Uncharacterized protein n=1 Tax=Candidatus Kentrum eta TaxID=2126337 RepID=A0A450UU29_9GAMM|nr:MAG: hypothetical protein BECKH772A_GA0070896_100836 [Candidatus Kentron sp. H]VFJ96037.1 MAG: hypothetical protein BECKH772B_GA0070898_100866 [Candidatus Kentron sp. H]VFK02123.1 MAG: hypothetical protein BECKH772C_GA0070978_100826 [Candidatus Kentron sp. H]